MLHLIDTSLVTSDGAGSYRLHELARRYAAEQLAAAGVEAAVRRDHFTDYVKLAEAAAAHFAHASALTWLSRLDHEYDNLRVALAWALEELAQSVDRYAQNERNDDTNGSQMLVDQHGAELIESLVVVAQLAAAGGRHGQAVIALGGAAGATGRAAGPADGGADGRRAGEVPARPRCDCVRGALAARCGTQRRAAPVVRSMHPCLAVVTEPCVPRARETRPWSMKRG